MVTQLFIARHGQTDWNRAHRLQGWCDPPINRRGWYQARRLAERLADISVDRIVTSALVRSQQTTLYFSETVPQQVAWDLNERRYGSFTGAQLGPRSPEKDAEFARRYADADDRLDWGETLGEFHQRVFGCVTELVQKYAGQTLLIVGHGGVNGQIVRGFQRIAPDEGKALRPSNDTIYWVEIPDDWQADKEAVPVWLYVNAQRKERVIIRRSLPKKTNRNVG